MKLEAIKTSFNLLYRDRQSVCLSMLCSRVACLPPLPSPHLPLVVKDAVGFTADRLLANCDAENGLNLKGKLSD